MTETETKKKPTTTRKAAAPKTIVMQMEVTSLCAQAEGPPAKVIVWKEMTGEDFGDKGGTDEDRAVILVFSDSAAARRRLRDALETGSIECGTTGADTFQVVSRGEKFTPTVVAKTHNLVTM